MTHLHSEDSSKRESIVGVWLDHVKVAKIPLAINGLGAVLTLWVDQIRELFYLLVNSADLLPQVVAVVMAGLLGVVVWLATRTAFLFDLPGLFGLRDPRGEWIRTWAPRVLGALVPMLMLAGYGAALRQPAIGHSAALGSFTLLAVFLVEAIVLFTLGVKRRAIQKRLGSSVALDPRMDARLTRWSHMRAPARRAYTALFVANLLALILSVAVPGLLSHLGPVAVILLVACFGTATGTYLTILAYRRSVPLLTGLFALAVVWQWAGWNDNHHVRLFPTMNSTMVADLSSPVERGTPRSESFEEYAKAWLAQRPGHTPIYLVSAEGGGIRAAAWAALVLTELDLSSHGEFGKSVLAGSGVSGGSLGLAVYDAMLLKAHSSVDFDPMHLRKQLDSFMEVDFVAPVIESLFLPDAAQRMLPGRWFIDRGQRLEEGWETAWRTVDGCPTDVAGATAAASYCNVFRKPWGTLWSGVTRDGYSAPILFMNSTDVATGQRFVQYPFASLWSAGGVPDSLAFHGAAVSVSALPRSAPLSAVVHNSARFTYVSPAGTLLAPSNSSTPRRQLVDGGYFENSGATTLAELLPVLQRLITDQSCDDLSSADCRIHVIHISNDAGVEKLLTQDACVGEPGHDLAYGEVVAPAAALYHTRDARGAYARMTLRRMITSTGEEGPKQRFFHFRLCTGIHPLPLGWTLSDAAMKEMRHQLCNPMKTQTTDGEPSPNATFNLRQVSHISRASEQDIAKAGLCN